MSFAKLDERILTSSVWKSLEQSRMLETAFLKAVPKQFLSAVPQLEPDSTLETGWMVPPGLYGFVELTTTALAHLAYLDRNKGVEALRALGGTDGDSRDPDYEGRRVVRVQGGFIVLNYIKYRVYDHKSASRSKAYRDSQRMKKVKGEGSTVTPVTGDGVTASRDVTHADANAIANVDANQSIPLVDSVDGGSVVEPAKGDGLSPARQSLFELFVRRGVRRSLALEGATGPNLSDADVEEIARHFRRLLNHVKKSGATSQSSVLARRCQTGRVLDDVDQFRVVDSDVSPLRGLKSAIAPSRALKNLPQVERSEEDSRLLAPLLDALCRESGVEITTDWSDQLKVIDGGVVCCEWIWLKDELKVAAKECGLHLEFSNDQFADTGIQ